MEAEVVEACEAHPGNLSQTEASLLAAMPLTNMIVFLGDGSAQTVGHAVTSR